MVHAETRRRGGGTLCGEGEECVVASWGEGGLVTEDLCVPGGEKDTDWASLMI
jgi:hypothetical protein